jgi:glycosyltransferase involved in cell wall biosynthesis
MRNRILYIHPAIRTYRVGIFDLLSSKLHVDFFWSGQSKPGSYVSKEVETILHETNIKYIQAKESKSFPVDNFSFCLLKLPFSKYDTFIFSNITSVPFLLLAPILKVMGKKIIIFDELWRYPHEIFKYKVIYPYVKFLSRYCLDSVVAAGSLTQQFYHNELGCNENQIHIAYNTTLDTKNCTQDELLNTEIQKKVGLATSKKKILYLGRVVRYKGLDILIKAMLNISHEYELLVVGEGEFLSECQELTSKLSLNNRVHFLGGCESYEAPYYYRHADLFVLPTRLQLNENVQIESWGFTINEAMALELPVITTTAVGAGADLIIDGVTGGLAKEGSVTSLASTINDVLALDLHSMGKKARQHVLATCCYQKNYKAYYNALDFE